VPLLPQVKEADTKGEEVLYIVGAAKARRQVRFNLGKGLGQGGEGLAKLAHLTVKKHISKVVVDSRPEVAQVWEHVADVMLVILHVDSAKLVEGPGDAIEGRQHPRRVRPLTTGGDGEPL